VVVLVGDVVKDPLRDACGLTDGDGNGEGDGDAPLPNPREDRMAAATRASNSPSPISGTRNECWRRTGSAG